MQLPVIFEDDNVVVIDKPAGISMHPGNSKDGADTIADLLKSKLDEFDDMERPGIVHRLDKDTSGVVVVAKNIATKNFLQNQFKSREVKKQYITLVKGSLKNQEAIIDLPIGRNRKNPLKRSVIASAKAAKTHYKVAEEIADCSLLNVMPETGRTHQIRVHLSYLGHPVVGDETYGSRNEGLDRQFLHAHKLSIKLPGHKKTSTFISELPDDLSNFLKKLKQQ